MIDTAEGQDIPRKGGPGVTRSDFLVINKIDLAPYVGVDLDQMEKDAKEARGERPFTFTNQKTSEGIEEVISWIKHSLLFEDVEKSGEIKSGS